LLFGSRETLVTVPLSDLKLVDFSGLLVLPVTSQFQREVELDGSRTGTIIGTATAVPAFFGMQDDRRFALFRMRYINVNLTGFHTNVASVADVRIKDHRIIRCSNIRKCEYFFLRHVILLKNFYK
jgi:hypothetical protein